MKVLRLLAVFAAGLALALAGCGSDDDGGGGGAGTTTDRSAGGWAVLSTRDFYGWAASLR